MRELKETPKGVNAMSSVVDEIRELVEKKMQEAAK